MENLIYLNGSLVPEKEAKISIIDRGFLYGEGLFETMRVYAGKVFKLDEHLKRLFQSSKVIYLPIPQGEEELKRAIYNTLETNGLWDAYLRLTISRGEGIGLELPSFSKPTVAIVAKPLLSLLTRWYDNGLRAVVVSVRRDRNSPLSNIKSLNYLPNILAKIEASRKGVDEGIILNNEGRLAEATASNIFLVSKGKILTPSIKSGILPGITRQTVIELSCSLGLDVVEREIELSELIEADEAFLTNSIRELVSLVEVDSSVIGKGSPGEITKKLMEEFKNVTTRC